METTTTPIYYTNTTWDNETIKININYIIKLATILSDQKSTYDNKKQLNVKSVSQSSSKK